MKCNRKLLPLSTRKLLTRKLKESHELSIVAFFKLIDERISGTFLSGLFNSLIVKRGRNVTKRNILSYTYGIFTEVLEYDAKQAIKFLCVIFSSIPAVKVYPTARRIVQSC